MEQAEILKFEKDGRFQGDICVATFKKGDFSVPVDTIIQPVRSCDSCSYNDVYFTQHNDRDLRDYSYIVFDTTTGLIDTIISIGYTSQFNTQTCNSCLFSRNEYTCEVKSNYTWNINGQTYYSATPDYVFKP
jgi:hypothetical protein